MDDAQSKFELDLDLQMQALALANPKLETTTRVDSGPERLLFVSFESGSQEEYHDNGASVFLLDSEFALYDSGCLVIVTYEYNESVSQCFENELLREDLPTRPISPVLFDKIQAKLNLKNIAEHATVRTGDDGQIIVDVRPFRLGCLLPQPGTNHPTVSISELRRQPYEMYGDLDVVTLANESSNDTYIFKQLNLSDRLGRHSSYSYADANPLLEQAQFLLKHSFPFVVQATALVADSSGDFRGYLMPFHPAQSLDKVLERLSSFMKPQLVLDSKHGPEPSLITADHDAIPMAQNEGAGREPYPMALQWRLKFAWVLDIVQAIDVLHGARICCGDIKLENVVLCVDGHCRLIDLLPGDLGYSIAYLAPEVAALLESMEDDLLHFLTYPRDVFAVGMLLWALAEEIGIFERKDPLFSPSLVWSSATPLWYRELAEDCIAQEPEDRPSAHSVLEILSEHWIQ